MLLGRTRLTIRIEARGDVGVEVERSWCHCGYTERTYSRGSRGGEECRWIGYAGVGWTGWGDGREDWGEVSEVVQVRSLVGSCQISLSEQANWNNRSSGRVFIPISVLMSC
jgi:hypothetical protein